ncbi:lipid-binding SYLF domain-containing protein [Fimbriiglobus ruber]|uniref:Ysc84 actin-binding domain-containing protein n=1 Tax=Fimbriiglobus ruber TaxID=1908690 RepID=A0A225DIG1_9BACT|nr:lipid-binding SYLF domain-containing protein [Fimbriiglobus ruber]OWK39484.1 hypothetical protein FRUB_06047 [Fimbriiglobus ruber]
MRRYLLTGLTIALFVAPAVALPPSNEKTLEDAAEVLDDLNKIPLNSIPAALLADAKGVAVIPRVIKAGFVVGGRGGHGIVMAKDKDGNWCDPVFVDLGGASVGFQAGVESTDVVLVFRGHKSLDRLLEGKVKITLGADAAVAAGPLGRMAAAATDAKLEAEIVSYSRNRGLFAGVSLEGAAIHANGESNTISQTNQVKEKKLANAVKLRLLEMSKQKPVPVVIPAGLVVPVRP